MPNPPSRARLLAPAFSRLIASLALPLACVFACAPSSSCRCKRPYSAFILLSCALGMLTTAKPAHAQGSVTGVTVTTSVSTVTVPVNTPATFTVTATPGTPNPDLYWHVISGPYYQWADYYDITPHDAASATFSKTYSSPGTYTVHVVCQVSYQVQYIRGGTASIVGTGTASPDVTINVIGGPITGDKDVRYYCDYPTETSPLSAAETGHLSAASGQPAGTTYSWSITGSATVTDGGTTPNATYRSVASGAASAVVTYTRDGVSASSPAFAITSHEPKIGKAVPSGPSADHIYYSPFGYGFDQQSIVYTVVDQDNPNMPMGGVPVEEVWRLTRYDPMANNSWPVPGQESAVTAADGTFTDYFSVSNYTLAGFPGDPTFLTRPQSEPIAYLKHWWYAGPSTSNTQKGCVLENYPNVTYSTNGVTGD